MRRRRFIQLAALGGAALVGGVGVTHAAPRSVRLTRHRFRLRAQRPLRVVQLTDLHLGWGTPEHLVEQAVALTRQAAPHLVVMTGDYLNHSLTHLERLRRLVARLPRPCVATLGNHDHWSGAAEITRALEAGGVQVLSNQGALVKMRDGRRLEVAGIDDGVTDHDDVPRALSGLRSPARALILSHDPRAASLVAARGGRLVLAGHTHGGQVNVPLVTRAVLGLAGQVHVAGWYRLGETRLYVNAGIGCSAIRLRAGRRSAPEVALFELS